MRHNKMVQRVFFLVFFACLCACTNTAVHESADWGTNRDPSKPDEVEWSLTKSASAVDKAGADFASADVPAMDEQAFKEFEAFKAWLRAREENSPDYQAYQDWQAYQQFRRYQSRQAEQKE